jgi:glutamine cyclotransferase
MSGKVVHTMDYFNAVISGMVFSDKNLLTVTYDGRVMSTRLKDMKLLNTTTLPGNGTNYCLVKADQDHLWIKDSLDTVYRVDVDSLSCRQKIDNTIAIDPVNEWSYIYELTGTNDISNAKLTVGRVPLLTDQEIIDKAEEYIGGRTMSEEERVYYGAGK